MPASPLFGPLAAGSYSFRAVYGGDSNYAGSTSDPEPLTVQQGTPAVVTEITDVNHVAISVTKEKWEHLRGKLDAAGVEYHMASGTSIYFRDPDGVRLELLADPLGEMYGTKVL